MSDSNNWLWFLPLLQVEFKPGSANSVEDALSRSPVSGEDDENTDDGQTTG